MPAFKRDEGLPSCDLILKPSVGSWFVRWSLTTIVMSVLIEELAFKEIQFTDCINFSISGTENVVFLFSLIAFKRSKAFYLNSFIGIFNTSSSPEIKIISSWIEYSKSPLFSERKTLIIG